MKLGRIGTTGEIAHRDAALLQKTRVEAAVSAKWPATRSTTTELP
jgi:hypothetical protein